MCGIVGLYLKATELAPDLGRLTAGMLHEMRDRGPDSAGFAVYGAPTSETRITLLSGRPDRDWRTLCDALKTVLAAEVQAEVIADHAVLSTDGDPIAARNWLIEHHPDITVLSTGRAIEIFKGIGDPDAIAERYHLAQRSGSHAIAHTRMATESAVTIAGSHPFSTGEDTCLVHNGSLSNHNWLRQSLQRAGQTFQTENDSEVAAGYFADRVRQGDDLDTALGHAITDLDGFYTFAIGTRNGFAVLRDPIACKPAVIAETDAWVAMSSEFRAIATLPGVEHAAIWEPQPAKIYSWERPA